MGSASSTTDVSNASVGQLLSEVTSDLSTLMRQEMELAKAELRQEATKAGKGAGFLGGAGFAGYMLALFASLALMFALAELDFIGLWAAALIVAVIYGIVGFVLFKRGRRELKNVNPMPTQTVETLKEDVQWAKTQTR